MAAESEWHERRTNDYNCLREMAPHKWRCQIDNKQKRGLNLDILLDWLKRDIEDLTEIWENRKKNFEKKPENGEEKQSNRGK